MQHLAWEAGSAHETQGNAANTPKGSRHSHASAALPGHKRNMQRTVHDLFELFYTGQSGVGLSRSAPIPTPLTPKISLDSTIMKRLFRGAVLLVTAVVTFAPGPYAFALPAGFNLQAGQVGLPIVNGNQMILNQTSGAAIIHWDSF